MLLWIWSFALVLSAYLYLKTVYSKFKNAGVNHRRPIPVVGNLLGTVLKYEHMSTIIQKTYNAFPGDRFVGHYEFINAVTVIKDLELIKMMTVKDFDHFVDHRTFVSVDDPLFGRNLFSMKGDEWRDMRSTLSPAFTSSKIRLMVPFMVEVGDQMIAVLTKKINNAEKGYLDCDVKDLTTRYANDVIASCAFGLKVDSMENENNDFYIRGREASTFTFAQILKLFLNMSFPTIMKKLNFQFFSEETKSFFIGLITSVMKERDENKINRPDMIQLLIEAKKGSLSHESHPSQDADAGFATVEESEVGQKKSSREWSDIDLVAQAVLFFLAGFDTVSTTMSFLLFELAINPEIQDKLVKEIENNEEKNGGKFDYKSVQDMQYLDMVVSEAMRLWPSVIATDRVCAKDYNLGKPNEKATKDYIIKKGEPVWFPVYAIHRNPEYYPNPDKFIPERFSIENRKDIKPFTYMPFGLGPRNCIGSRFALCETKVFIYQLLKHVIVTPGAKTQLPIRLAPESFNPRIQGGHWLRLQLRK